MNLSNTLFPALRPLFLTLVATLTITESALALEKQTLLFSIDGTSENTVQFSFDGRKFYPMLRIDGGKAKVDGEMQPIYEFLSKMYNNNIKGDAASILELWAPAERSAVKALMTDEALETNRNKFRAAEALNLHMLMLFGPYYIAYVEYDFGVGGKAVLKTPMKVENGEFFLTNELNGNHFYDQISDHLVR